MDATPESGHSTAGHAEGRRTLRRVPGERSGAELRVAWEFQVAGVRTQRSLRAANGTADLDSGYLSAPAARARGRGLSPSTRPGRLARPRRRLTEAGRPSGTSSTAARRSRRSLLAPLSDPQRERLVTPMSRGRAAPDRRRWSSSPSRTRRRPDARFCLGRVLRRARRAASTPASTRPAASRRCRPSAPAGRAAAGRHAARRPVGCGALKLHGGGPAEIKRMWIAPDGRGLGLGRRLLAELEPQARPRGAACCAWRPTATSPRRSPSTARRLPRGAGVQRRAVRAPLVREALARP